MAKYLVSNSKFKPFSYEEMLGAVKDYTTAYNTMEDKYNELATSANVWNGMINPTDEREKDLYNQYTNYMKDLNSAVEDLSRNGLSKNSRKELIALNSRYAKEINPIKLAYDAREADRKRVNDLIDKDDSMMFTSNPRNAALSDYINGKMPERQGVSGNDIMKRAAAQAQASSKRQFNDPQTKQILGGQYFQIMESMGYTQNQALAFAGGDYDAIPGLMNSINEILNSVNISAYSSQDRQKMISYAMEGALAGLQGNIDYKHHQNHGWKNPIDSNELINDIDNELINDIDVNPSLFYTPEEVGQYAILAKYIEPYKDNDGNIKYRLTDKGKEEYNRSIPGLGSLRGPLGTPATVMSGTIPPSTSDHSLLYNVLSQLEYDPNSDNLTDIVNMLMEKDEISPFDATQRVQYKYSIDESQQSDIKKKIFAAYGSQGIQGIKFDKETNTIKNAGVLQLDNGEHLTKEKLAEDYDIISINMSIYGNTFTAVNKKTGQKAELLMPTGIHYTNEGSRDAQLNAAKEYRDNILSLYNKIDEKETTQKQKQQYFKDIEYFRNLYEIAIKTAYMYNSQLFSNNKTVGVNYNTYGY